MPSLKNHRILYYCGAALLLVGCASSRTSNTARTGVEQMLISNAVDNSLAKIDFRPFHGQKVFLEEKYVDCVDKNYLVSAVRHRILTQGGIIVDKREDAEVVLEMRSGGVGTDVSDSFVGVPEITLPGVLTLPEVRLLTRSKQIGTAKIGLVAIDQKSQRALGLGGTALAQSDDTAWFVAGVGPFKSGSIREEVSNGTSGHAGRVRNQLPNYVSFVSPVSDPGKVYTKQQTPPPAPGSVEEPAPPDLQLTSSPEEVVSESPADRRTSYLRPIAPPPPPEPGEDYFKPEPGVLAISIR